MSRTLFQITEDLQALDDLLADVGGDVSEDQAAAAIDSFFAELDKDLKDKADNYAALIRTMDLRSKARKEEADRLAKLAKSDDNNATRLKNRLKEAFESRGIARLDTARFKLGIARNSGVQPLDVHVTAEELPPAYQQVEVKPNTKAIREALASGKEIHGCVLMDRGTRLSIR